VRLSWLAKPFTNLWAHRQLAARLILRDILGKYRGSFVGVLWSLLNPLLMLAIYSFMFSIVFKARGTTSEATGGGFAVFLFVGMIMHGLLADCIGRGPSIIVGNSSYVKKVVFPIDILPWVALGTALFNAVIGFIVLLGAILLSRRGVPWTAVYFPFILLPLLLGAVGIMWFLSAVGVYIRDIGQLTSFVSTMLLYLSPVLYPVSALPLNLQFWMRLNPLSFVIEQGREVLLVGHQPDWIGLIVYTFVGGVIAIAGYGTFQSLRKGFADVI